MRRWGLGSLSCACVAFALMHVAACGLDVDGTADTVDATADQVAVDAHLADNIVPMDGGIDGQQDVQQPDASLPDTAPPMDSGPPDTGMPCSAFLCGSACVLSCVGCAFGTGQCNGDRTCGDCSTCSDGKFACYQCSGPQPFGLCQGTKCNSPGPMACPCPDGDAATCPGKTQICDMGGGGGGAGTCVTCGTGGTDHKQCENGTTCTESTGTCQ